jgi:hypothetical protein
VVRGLSNRGGPLRPGTPGPRTTRHQPPPLSLPKQVRGWRVARRRRGPGCDAGAPASRGLPLLRGSGGRAPEGSSNASAQHCAPYRVSAPRTPMDRPIRYAIRPVSATLQAAPRTRSPAWQRRLGPHQLRHAAVYTPPNAIRPSARHDISPTRTTCAIKNATSDVTGHET